jgi:diaminohydroxyphosphoribosylaminopyrimidine deaminase/5-amino-6-(5-phosphoribosylamino)uracil reductase
VLDADGASIHAESELVKTVADAPLIICLSDDQPVSVAERLQNLGAEVLRLPPDSAGRLCVRSLLKELGRREMTHVLVEAGGGVMGAFFDAELIDEVHVFIAPKLVGGSESLSPVAGTGRDQIPELPDLSSVQVERFVDDVLIRGRVVRSQSST